VTHDDDGLRPRIEIITATTDANTSSRNSRIAGGLFATLGLVAGLAAGWVALPALLYGRQEQPLPFNHLVHVEAAGMSCEDCHPFADDGSFRGIPATASCVDCHSEQQGATEAERILVEDYVATGREIPWLVYSRQPDNVYFSHAPHVRRAGLECRRCHGDRGMSTGTPVYEFNRITGYSRAIWGPRIQGGGPNEWDSMKMSDCVDCHAASGVQDHCLMCHK
jgi:hypothetical protein